jgi:ABC-2 type transport system ATP-binding protein
MTGALDASHLSKVIGDRTIVDDVSFELHPGEVFGFLGPNGAGKTTTIRMLVGLIKPTRGAVTVCGYDLRRDFENAMRCIGCIVENPDLYRFMTGRENLEHFARMLGVRADEIERVASLVNLAHRLDQRVGTYSLGMRQRLGIAQAMLGNPRVLILDEPASARSASCCAASPPSAVWPSSYPATCSRRSSSPPTAWPSFTKEKFCAAVPCAS